MALEPLWVNEQLNTVEWNVLKNLHGPTAQVRVLCCHDGTPSWPGAAVLRLHIRQPQTATRPRPSWIPLKLSFLNCQISTAMLSTQEQMQTFIKAPSPASATCRCWTNQVNALRKFILPTQACVPTTFFYNVITVLPKWRLFTVKWTIR